MHYSRLTSIVSMQKHTSSYYPFLNQQDVSLRANQTGTTLVTLDGLVLDATAFAPMHPGGHTIIQHFSGKDVTAPMKDHHQRAVQLAHTMAIGSLGKPQEKFLLEVGKPLAGQIWDLNPQDYAKAVECPQWMGEPSPRLFQTEWMELCSRTRWYHVALLPLLAISYMAWNIDTWSNINPGSTALTIAAGILSLTLFEYLLHRFVFHAEQWLPDVKLLRMAHFFMHGIHHMLPFDPYRLVLPPPFALILMIITRPLIANVNFADPLTSFFFWSGFLTAYVIYDVTHYYLHFLDIGTVKFKWFQGLQRHHTQHHYGPELAGFGVSSPLWDIVFGTSFKVKPHPH